MPKTIEGRAHYLMLAYLWLCCFVGLDAEAPDASVSGAADVAELKEEIQALRAAIEKLAASNEL